MIYIIHLNTPIKHARHYVGYVHDERGVQARFNEHCAGKGSRLLQVALHLGITFTLAATMPVSKNDERAFKNRKNTPYYCPICNPKRHKTCNSTSH
ncbi:endonuclease [Sphingobacteriales bacterium UPWRP_1]|nr:hypothetical protein BVG80_17375 [Sphingobacteriales bacterium TSM_CSM]PSJ74205.1 endonuclease [Sphingobacteriales bacterium UPWRP_1]